MSGPYKTEWRSLGSLWRLPEAQGQKRTQNAEVPPNSVLLDHRWRSGSVYTCHFEMHIQNAGYVCMGITRQGPGYQDFKKEWKNLEEESGI